MNSKLEDELLKVAKALDALERAFYDRGYQRASRTLLRAEESVQDVLRHTLDGEYDDVELS